MYETQYENHFLNIRVSREKFLEFAQYTATTLTESDNEKLHGLAAAFQADVDAFSNSLVQRTGQAGAGKGNTYTQDEVVEQLREFARDTNTELLQPKLRKTPAVLLSILPQGLSYLTNAVKKDVPTRFEAFVKALEAQQAVLGKEVAVKGRELLQLLATATNARTKGKQEATDTIGSLDTAWETICASLWKIHCCALCEYSDQPDKARAYFGYYLLKYRATTPDKTDPDPNL